MSHAIQPSTPAPSPSPAATHRANKSSSSSHAHETEASSKTDTADNSQESNTKKTNSSSADLSFMAALLSNIVNNNQNFSASSATQSDTEVDALGDEPAVKFGGTFNMDPSMLVLPEGMDAETLAALLEKSNDEFSAELLAALTPGIPTPPPDPVNVTTGQTGQVADDPRLIASGLTPADMQNLLDHLKSLALAMKQGETVVATPPVATVAIVPETVEVNPAQMASITAPVKTTSSTAEASASVANATATDNADVFADLLPTDSEEGEFDPVEFRLALKPSRYSTSVYQNPTPAAVATTSATTTTVNANEVIKGVMKDAGAHAPDVVMSSAVDGESGVASSMLVSDLDCVLGATSLVSTPALTTGVTNPVLQNVTAVQSHPATQAVAALIANKAQTSGSSGAQTLAIQLDPPELGRLQLKMKYERGEPLKVHVVLEKADTLAMFQRDAHALQDALNQAGVKTDSSSLSFSMAQDQNAFQNAMNNEGFGSNRQGGSAGGEVDLAMDNAPIETKMPIFTDPKTGLTHYNILA